MLGGLTSCGSRGGSALTVTFYKIGKADAILLQEDGDAPFSVLIDTGEADDAPEITAKLRAAGADTLDCLILTHFDKDHIGGVPEILSSVSVRRILMPAYEGTGEAYDAMLTAFEANGIPAPEILTADTAFTLGKTDFLIDVPKAADYGKNQDNNQSLIVTVTHGDNRLLFAGDAEKLRQREFLSLNSLSPVTLLKVPHHGVWNKGLDDFFSALSPAYAVITCSDKNPPEDQTLSALAACGTKTYLTQDGDIVCTVTEHDCIIRQ